ncbi:MAG: ABC transporter ATP-binding protein [Rhodospirillaceae bacterium]|nr:ABC transporter ATP-binding protein [Rhodospirillaceae bacterium]MBT5079089.1 ABC transporter ATP-binding protein [Rhodospirillaceae bacterium]MBT5526182.1 ABC transporter ATP-binding protein [Rhodospirillaceae bacterium]MBT5882264.1 ABC transporter ATP-binding protein [Rhodospirillaceae bacterium]MBT6588134.1 ABC transporter ATP-binding protein [Rhodospirillaceae bacterium]
MSQTTDHRNGTDAAVLWRIIGLALRYKFRFAVAVGATIAASAFQLMIPRFLGDAVDNAMGMLSGTSIAPALAREALLDAALLLLGVSILRGAFTLLHNYGGEAIGHLIAYDLRLAFYAKLQELSFSFHDGIHSGELITRGMLDLEGVRMFVNTGVLRLVLLTCLIGAGGYLLLSTDLLLGLLSFSFVPFVAWRSSVARLRLRALWLALQQRMGTLGQIMDENLSGIRVVRAFGAERYEVGKYDVAADDARLIADERIKTRASSTSVMTFAYFIAMGLVLWVGGLRVLDGTMTVGTLTVFLTFITILQTPVRQLGLLVNSLARASTCGGRLFDLLDLEPGIRDQPGAKPLSVSKGALSFEEVSFAYSGVGGPPVLHDVSFTVARGRTVGIVGPPGSGKSTIANLLPRYYDPSSGRITIDGQDIRHATLASLRQAVRVVQQDAFLFTASLENNIAYGDPWADDGMIQDAASTAQIDGFVGGLPEGYGTLVGERGVSLSGGQKQRIAIARAAMLRSSVLIFDDSTAAIDAETEQRIREALKTPMQNCATIIISHRLGALRHADEIIFLEGGRIVERGDHDSLVAAKGRYAALFNLQSRNEDDLATPDIQGAAE